MVHHGIVFLLALIVSVKRGDGGDHAANKNAFETLGTGGSEWQSEPFVAAKWGILLLIIIIIIRCRNKGGKEQTGLVQRLLATEMKVGADLVIEELFVR
jgi:hypothetical protein